ncbi:MAG: SMI1/KNR4 family protein [Acidobacteria bacterium]|nr:SMI1/KNR4 family protein [Acidobacteriota bacterium]
MDFISRLNAFVRTQHTQTFEGNTFLFGLNPPATFDQIAQAEQQLGFRLPQILPQIYTTIGNGGLGPAYGLVGVERAFHVGAGAFINLVSVYLDFVEHYHLFAHQAWPDNLLPFFQYGFISERFEPHHFFHEIYLCVDLHSSNQQLYLSLPVQMSLDGIDQLIFPLECSISDLYEEWMADRDIVDQALEALFGGVDGTAT